MESSIELAQAATLRPIREIRDGLGLHEDDFDFYGRHVGKVRLSALDRLADQPDGRLILVTAMTPTRFGEGKTLTSVGLGQALGHLGKKGVVALREPSLGPVFGIKGGAAGGGYAQVLPMEQINLHFTGDLHAITAAHNLLAAMLDNHVFKGNDRRLDVTQLLWNRALDVNDRALRQTVVGLGGRVNGVPRESGFVITAASEVMAILALAQSRADLKRRLGSIVVGYTHGGDIVRARDLDAAGAMAALLNDAIAPNLVQTMEGTPALVHAGPFANIAHGTSSVLAAQIARKTADYVITEAGFGADLGAEKFFDIVCRHADLWPSAVVLVVTGRAIKRHGGVPTKPSDLLTRPQPEAFRKGLANVDRHLANLRRFGVSVVVAMNRFPWDTPDEIEMLRAFCDEREVAFATHEAFAQGGAGAIDLAETVVAVADANPAPTPRFLYDLAASPEEKIEAIATEIYGASGIYFEKRARKKLERFVDLGFGGLPVCMAKTQSSLSDNGRLLGAPTGWQLTVSDVNLSAGAGFLVVVCGDMLLMPGLPRVPAAAGIDVDDAGRITGLF